MTSLRSPCGHHKASAENGAAASARELFLNGSPVEGTLGGGRQGRDDYQAGGDPGRGWASAALVEDLAGRWARELSDHHSGADEFAVSFVGDGEHGGLSDTCARGEDGFNVLRGDLLSAAVNDVLDPSRDEQVPFVVQ